MKYMMTLISMSILLLAACGQTPAKTSSAEAKPTEQVSESESTDQQNEDEETMDAETEDENQDTENATDAENSETGSTEETETETTSTETESAVTATGTSDADAETEVDDEQVTTETDQGVDEIADPSYTEVTSDDYQDQIATLKNQFQNQLLSIELENGEDWGYVYAVVTDGLKLPSDEEREFHLLQMAEAITEQLDLKAQAPGGTITFVYEDQSVLGIYHTEDGSIGYP
ncbi:hypothetical protein [Alkalicoccobacillus gibsonii]|uniref:hypothetical protein n=1 Tax=Alkalicoccobacillus gibsonii TaxID=79881 RepID=UPI003519083D